jgi:type IV secretion system protein VirB10
MKLTFFLIVCGLPALYAQDLPTRDTEEAPADGFSVETGTKIPLTLLNSISSKQTAEGDRVYLETVFPVLVNGKIVIPPGSHVMGTVTRVKRPGRIKGRGELYLRFDSLILPNGVTRDFRARIGGMDGGGNNELDRDEGKVKGGGSKGEDARDIAQSAQLGTMVGGLGGAVAGRPGTGLAAGAAGGTAAGLLGVLLTRGPDVLLTKGSMVEMVLDRQLLFGEKELDFSGAPPARPRTIVTPAEPAEKPRQSLGLPLPL